MRTLRTARTAIAVSAALLAGLAASQTASAATAPAAAARTSYATCTGSNTTVTAAKVQRPINHLLLKATNTSRSTCAVYLGPYLRFDQAQAATPFIEESHPQAVLLLKPGQSAYSAVVLQGEDTSTLRKVKKLKVLFGGRSGHGSVGAAAAPKLPANTYLSDDAAVTYWQPTAADALQW
ncbi:DUF4232 domain-containing protein [Streptomyces sp. NPDC089919]|uniref:DUF4232 domain-containing protein n=1 Tax=Streptomyces sp. NPDC089919 TaxID=3155188 RepID=UPI0034206FC9